MATFGGKLDILVNNAGTAIPKPFEQTTLEELESMLDLNLRGPFVATHAALKQMNNGGRIIMIGSCVGERILTPGLTAYSATKGGVKMFTQGLAREVGARGITVNNVQPGPIDTDLNPADERMGQAADRRHRAQSLRHRRRSRCPRRLRRQPRSFLHHRRQSHRRRRHQRIVSPYEGRGDTRSPRPRFLCALPYFSSPLCMFSSVPSFTLSAICKTDGVRIRHAFPLSKIFRAHSVLVLTDQILRRIVSPYFSCFTQTMLRNKYLLDHERLEQAIALIRTLIVVSAT